jgi:hypothetical protein
VLLTTSDTNKGVRGNLKSYQWAQRMAARTKSCQVRRQLIQPLPPLDLMRRYLQLDDKKLYSTYRLTFDPPCRSFQPARLRPFPTLGGKHKCVTATFFVCFLLFLTLVDTRGAFAARLHFLAKIRGAAIKFLRPRGFVLTLVGPFLFFWACIRALFRGGSRGVF